MPVCATILVELHEAINAHLDEERLVLPLSAAHLGAEESNAFGQRALASISAGTCRLWLVSDAPSNGAEQLRKPAPACSQALAKSGDRWWAHPRQLRRGTPTMTDHRRDRLRGRIGPTMADACRCEVELFRSGCHSRVIRSLSPAGSAVPDTDQLRRLTRGPRCRR